MSLRLLIDSNERPQDDDGMRTSSNTGDVLSGFNKPVAQLLINIQPRLQAIAREMLAKDLLTCTSLQQKPESLSNSTKALPAALQRRHARYMLIMGAIIGEFLRSTHHELTLSVFVKELEFYFASNVFSDIPDRGQQSHYNTSPLISELDRGMSIFGLIELIGVAPYSKFGKQLQRNFHGSAPSERQADITFNETANATYRSSTTTFLFQMLRNMETSGMFDVQAEIAVQVNTDYVTPTSADSGTINNADGTTPKTPRDVLLDVVPPGDQNSNASDSEMQNLLAGLEDLEIDREGAVHISSHRATLKSASHVRPSDTLKTRRQDIVLNLKRLLQKQYDQQLSTQVERLRNDELVRIRGELEEHYRTQLLQSQLELERDYKQRCADVAGRERQLDEKFSQRQSEFEREEHIKRTKLLLEIEKFTNRERDFEDRYQLRSQEISDANARLEAVQAEVSEQNKAVRKRERKLTDLQSAVKKIEQESRQHFQTELENQRKSFNDEEHRLRHFIEELAARNEILTRENAQLRGHINENGTDVRKRQGNNTAADKKSVDALERELQNGTLQREKPANSKSVKPSAEGALLQADNVDSHDAVEEIRSKLWQLNRRYITLKQRYSDLKEKNVRGFQASAEQRFINKSSKMHADDSTRKQSRQHNQQNPLNHTRPYYEVDKHYAGNLDANERLLDELTRHFKTQDSLKHELAHEIDRGIQSLSMHASLPLVTPPLTETVNTIKPVVFDHNRNMLPPRSDHWSQAQFTPSNHENVEGASENYARKNNTKLDFLRKYRDEHLEQPGGEKFLPGFNAAAVSSNQQANKSVSSFRIDEAETRPEQIYELRRLEKRLEQSMAVVSAKHGRRRKTHKNENAKKDANNRPQRRRSPVAVVSTKSDESVAAAPLAGRRRSDLMHEYSSAAVISHEFEDVELRQLAAERQRLDEYMFRPLPPLEVPTLNLYRKINNDDGADVKASGDSERSQQRNTALNYAPVRNTEAEPEIRQMATTLDMLTMSNTLPHKPGLSDKNAAASLSHATSASEYGKVNPDENENNNDKQGVSNGFITNEESYMDVIQKQRASSRQNYDGNNILTAHSSAAPGLTNSHVPATLSANDTVRASVDDWFDQIRQQQRQVQQQQQRRDNDSLEPDGQSRPVVSNEAPAIGYAERSTTNEYTARAVDFSSARSANNVKVSNFPITQVPSKASSDDSDANDNVDPEDAW